jgi:hypothetical protein
MQADLELIMGAMSFSRNGVSAHITAEGEWLNDKQGQQCDLCFDAQHKGDLIRIVDDRFSICQRCYLKHLTR